MLFEGIKFNGREYQIEAEVDLHTVKAIRKDKCDGRDCGAVIRQKIGEHCIESIGEICNEMGEELYDGEMIKLIKASHSVQHQIEARANKILNRPLREQLRDEDRLRGMGEKTPLLCEKCKEKAAKISERLDEEEDAKLDSLGVTESQKLAMRW